MGRLIFEIIWVCVVFYVLFSILGFIFNLIKLLVIKLFFPKKYAILKEKLDTLNSQNYFSNSYSTFYSKKRIKNKLETGYMSDIEEIKAKMKKLIPYWEDNISRNKELEEVNDLSRCKIQRNDNTEEYYNENGNLVFVCKIDENGIKNGEYIEYYKNGKIWSKGNYKNGHLMGECTNYFPNGNISQIANFENGLQNGNVLLYYETGELQSINIYKDNILQSKPEIYAKDGNRIL